MRYRSEKILLLESRPYYSNWYAGTLTSLGFTQLVYANYASVTPFRTPLAPVDAVVAVWTDDTIVVDRFAGAVAAATERPGVRGALILSPFATAANARLLMGSGAKAWIRPPISKGEISAKLHVMMYGERRRDVVPVRPDRRAPLHAVSA